MRSAFAALVALGLLAFGATAAEPADTGRPALKDALSKLKVPPAWFATTQTQWDVTKPWKDGRIEIRRLLGVGGDSAREAIKLTYSYLQKNDIGDGHEWPMYLFMGGEYAWALQEYSKYIQKIAGKGGTHAYQCYASCYAHFGEYTKTLEVLQQALRDLPAKPWRIANEANVRDQLGDTFALMNQNDKAKAEYAEAIRLYPTSDQPFGKHTLTRKINKVQTKLDLLTLASLQNTKLKDGSYIGKSIGYSDAKDLEAAVTIQGGKIADIKVKHEEKIELGAATIIPQRIIAKQSLKVDAITGATVTSQAIVDATFQALKQAGLK